MKTRSIVLACASAAALAIVGASLWVDPSQVSAGDCDAQEADDYPHLEKVAREVAGEVGDRFSRYSFCEDAGIPGAAVRVSVYEWSNRPEAREFLSNLPVADPHSDDPDSDDTFMVRGVEIQYIKTVDYLENDGRSFVTLSFNAPR
jgi:hypothetical protein